ncbi:MAG TPA: hypothetical protein VFK80_10330 [Limnochordia bacterium]|nr:hypothetical protein [Limnochordia bacterium]
MRRTPRVILLSLALAVIVAAGVYGVVYWRDQGATDQSGCDPTQIAETPPLTQPDGVPSADAGGQAEYGFREVAADRALRAGDLRTAVTSLELGAEEAHNATYAESVEATKLLFEVAMIGAEVEASNDLQSLADQAGATSERGKYLAEKALEWGRRANGHVRLLSDDAKAFKNEHYRRGVALKSPLKTVIHRGAAQNDASNAQKRLAKANDDDAVEQLTDGLYHTYAGEVVDEALVQACPGRDAVITYGPIRVPTLLWLVGSKLNDSTTAEWYMREIVALTADQPGDPIRKRAQDVIAQYFSGDANGGNAQKDGSGGGP